MSVLAGVGGEHVIDIQQRIDRGPLSCCAREGRHQPLQVIKIKYFKDFYAVGFVIKNDSGVVARAGDYRWSGWGGLEAKARESRSLGCKILNRAPAYRRFWLPL